ncbi:MAG: PaRep2b protein, partial [Pyrobaculum sp.]|nr:PaRep2b protein [Pyrobaculum sp.]
TLREKLNEYSVEHGLGGLLDVNEDVARRLAEAKQLELSRFSGVSFGVKAYAALVAYREYALGRRSPYGVAAWHWLEVGGSAWLLYYEPITAYNKAKKAKVVRPAAVEELVAEALRRLFLKPGADHLHGFVEELTKGGRLALELEEKKTKEKTGSYVFRLYNVKEGGGLKELDIRLRIRKLGESIVYALEFDDIERWQGFFKQKLEAAMKAAEEVRERLPVEDRFPYMVGWVDSDVAIIRRRNERVLQMSTSHLWQLAETHALFDWSNIVVRGVSLTLEGPKPEFYARTSLEKLDDAIKKSVECGWLNMLGTKAGLKDLMYVKSWDDLKRWVADHWGIVVNAAVRRLGEGVRGELEALRDRLNDDKIAREVVAPALLLIQAERLGVNETTLRYFGAVVSGAIDGDGTVYAAMRMVGLTSGKYAVALLWGAALAAYGIKTKVEKSRKVFLVAAFGGDAVRLAGLYFRYKAPLLEGDERIINHKLAEAVKLAAERLSVSWEGLRRRTEDSPVAADLIISADDIKIKYNVYLRKDILLQFRSTDRSRVELAALLLRLAGVSAEVRKEVGGRDVWCVVATTDKLAVGHEELRKALAEVVRAAVEKGWVDANKAERWLKKLEEGLTLMEGWPKYEVGPAKAKGVVRFTSTNSGNIEREAQRLKWIGLKEGVHFTVKMPKGGKAGYILILKEGLAYAAWLSVYGKDEQQRRLAAEFVKHILRRAEKKGKDVYRKVEEIVKEGMSRGFSKAGGL